MAWPELINISRRRASSSIRYAWMHYRIVNFEFPRQTEQWASHWLCAIVDAPGNHIFARIHLVNIITRIFYAIFFFAVDDIFDVPSSTCAGHWFVDVACRIDRAWVKLESIFLEFNGFNDGRPLATPLMFSHLIIFKWHSIAIIFDFRANAIQSVLEGWSDDLDTSFFPIAYRLDLIAKWFAHSFLQWSYGLHATTTLVRGSASHRDCFTLLAFLVAHISWIFDLP